MLDLFDQTLCYYFTDGYFMVKRICDVLYMIIIYSTSLQVVYFMNGQNGFTGLSEEKVKIGMTSSLNV